MLLALLFEELFYQHSLCFNLAAAFDTWAANIVKSSVIPSQSGWYRSWVLLYFLF